MDYFDFKEWNEMYEAEKKRNINKKEVCLKTAGDIAKVTVGTIAAYGIIKHKDMPIKVIETLLERSLKNRGLI